MLRLASAPSEQPAAPTGESAGTAKDLPSRAPPIEESCEQDRLQSNNRCRDAKGPARRVPSWVTGACSAHDSERRNGIACTGARHRWRRVIMGCAATRRACCTHAAAACDACARASPRARSWRMRARDLRACRRDGRSSSPLRCGCRRRVACTATRGFFAVLLAFAFVGFFFEGGERKIVTTWPGGGFVGGLALDATAVVTACCAESVGAVDPSVGAVSA